MKKGLQKFITMLILMIMALEIVLPVNVYAESGETSTEDEEIYVPEESGWYDISYEKKLELYTSDMILTEQNAAILKYFGNIYSFNESGNKEYPIIKDEYGYTYYIYLEKDIEYRVPKNFGEAANLVYKVSIEDAEKNDATAIVKSKEFPVKQTGWYKKNSIDIQDKPIYYYNESGERLEPTSNVDKNGNKIVFLTAGTVYYVPDSVSYIILEEYKTNNLFSEMIASFFYSIANGLNYLVGMALGENVTIDDLVFNNYSETNISYFEKMENVENPSKLIYGTNGIGGLDGVVNTWYAIFMKIALMGYMVMLVYMGIRIMLSSTAEKKADYKKLFMNWVIGLAILLIFPYAMKYIIKINESFVEVIEANKGYEDKVSSAVENIDTGKSLLDIEIDYEINWEEGTDYMSVIATAARDTKNAALSLAFLIMTWQLIALIFHYYKRLFMIAFLIIIFPLVGLFYAVDKIADGKSQAFNTWLKEFLLNVLVQTFHAIVYVFVCSTVYSASGVATGIGYDFILVIVGVTFLYSGEEIIRQIFGQVSSAGTIKSLKENAALTFAKFSIATGAIKTAASYTVGEKSIPYKLNKGATSLRALNAKQKAFDLTAEKAEDFHTEKRLPHADAEPPKDMSDEEKKDFYKNREKYFKAAVALNNPNSNSYEEKARALNALTPLATKNPKHDVFKDTKDTAAQFAAVAALDTDVQKMMMAGMSRVEITREVTARMGVIFDTDSDEKIKDRVNTYFTALYIDGKNNAISKKQVNTDVENIKKEIEKIENSIVFANDDDNNDVNERDVQYIYDQYEVYIDDSENDDDRNRVMEFARNIKILQDRDTGRYNAKQLLEAADYVNFYRNYSGATYEMTENELDVDTDVFMHVLSKKAMNYSASEDIVRFAEEVKEDYEKDPRKDYFDDELSVHEIIKFKDNQAELDKMIEDVYENKQNAMKEATENLAEEYLVENEIDIMKNSYDTSVVTQEGLTYEETLAERIATIGETLNDLSGVGKGGSGLLDWILKERVAKKEEERTGIIRSIEDRRRVNDMGTSAKDYIEKNKEERDRIQNEHLMGDIGDRKDK